MLPKEGTEFKFRNLSIYEDNIAVNGAHFTGKTHFALKNIVKPLKKAEINFWFWNHHGKRLDLFEPDQIVYYLEDLKYGTQCYYPESKSLEHFNEFCKLVQKQNYLHVIFDELHNYMNAQTMAKELRPIITDLPANQAVTYTAIWQRASEGHKSVLSNAKHKFLFRFDVRDQDTYLDIFGTKSQLHLDKTARKYFPQEENCKPHSFVYRDEERAFDTEWYNGGKFYIPKTPEVVQK